MHLVAEIIFIFLIVYLTGSSSKDKPFTAPLLNLMGHVFSVNRKGIFCFVLEKSGYCASQVALASRISLSNLSASHAARPVKSPCRRNRKVFTHRKDGLTTKLQVKLHRKNKNVIICLWNEVLLCVTIQEDFCFIEDSCRTKG